MKTMDINTTVGQIWAFQKTAKLHNAWSPFNTGGAAYDRGFAPLVNKGDINITFEGEGETFLVVITPSPKMKRAGMFFQPIMLWTKKNESFPVLRALRKKSLRTGK